MTSNVPVPVAEGALAVPGARLYYEVRGAGPLVVLVGAPMDAEPFAAVADLLATDHTVLTTDPRGHNRSLLDEPDQKSTPQLRADDLGRLISNLDAGSAAVFGSSGGAVSTLALVQAHPELVHIAIAHEPPLLELLDDRVEQEKLAQDAVDTYLGGDVLGAWRKFFALTGIDLPEPVIQQTFGGDRPAVQVASERYWFEHEFGGTCGWWPDFDALRAAPTNIVIGIGDSSAGQFCDRAARALGAALGIEPTLFPGGHTGFTQEPVAFATRLRVTLSEH